MRTFFLCPLAAVVLSSTAAPAADVRSNFFTTSDGVRLHYLEAGSGPALFFEPGWTMPAEMWQSQIDYFAATRHVVALDPRSQGLSQQATDGHYCERRARDIKELVDHLNLSPVALVGWSMGVSESLCYIDQFGTSTLSALVLVDGSFGHDPDPAAKVMNWSRFEEMQKDRRGFTEHFVRGMYFKPHPEEYLRSIVEASMKTPTNTAVLLSANLAMRDDYRPILYRIDRPVLYTCQAANRAQGDVLRTYVRWARTEVFEDAGHALFVDDADRFNQLLDDFLRHPVMVPPGR
jgi:non-heme chloroperoxidase